jgi:hypothetical protein
LSRKKANDARFRNRSKRKSDAVESEGGEGGAGKKKQKELSTSCLLIAPGIWALCLDLRLQRRTHRGRIDSLTTITTNLCRRVREGGRRDQQACRSVGSRRGPARDDKVSLRPLACQRNVREQVFRRPSSGAYQVPSTSRPRADCPRPEVLCVTYRVAARGDPPPRPTD